MHVPQTSNLLTKRGPLAAQEAARVMPRRLSSPDEARGLLRRELGFSVGRAARDRVQERVGVEMGRERCRSRAL